MSFVSGLKAVGNYMTTKPTTTSSGRTHYTIDPADIDEAKQNLRIRLRELLHQRDEAEAADDEARVAEVDDSIDETAMAIAYLAIDAAGTPPGNADGL